MKNHKRVIFSVVILMLLLMPVFVIADYQATHYYPSGIPSIEKMRPNGDYNIYVLNEGKWQDVGKLAFDKYFRERELDLGSLTSGTKEVKMKLVQRGGGAAQIDSAFLGETPPIAIEGVENGFKKFSKADFDIADAFGKEILITFPEKAKDRKFRLTARVEETVISEMPFQFPAENLFKEMNTASKFYTYGLNSNNSFSPIFKEFSLTGTGHPSGYTYGYVKNDDKNLYVKIDFTPDNTMDGDKDYAKVYVKTKTGLREFKESVPETKWGIPDFTYTEKVSYQHKVYDFKIPFKELGIEDPKREKELLMAFAAYGTAGPACNGASISIPDEGPATPYPSNIVVSGLPGVVDRVTVNLRGLYHTWPDDIDILLIGPGGQNLILMSDTGGSYSISNVNLYFGDSYPSSLPYNAQIVSGYYKPTNYAGSADSFPSPAPTPSAATTLGTFTGTSPNGTWRLYVVDNAEEESGNISTGWCLNITTKPDDTTPPNVSVIYPAANDAVQDIITLKADASDSSGIKSVSFFVREPNGGSGTSIGMENLTGTYKSGHWEHSFDTTQLQDGYYVVLAKAVDNNNNAGWSSVVPFSIRNWAMSKLLPSTPTSKAGRTIPVKFTLRVASGVDQETPFVHNEDLEIRIYKSTAPGIILQTSHFGTSSTDYRIDSIAELYITNFKTLPTPAQYTVEIWRTSKNFMIGNFTFNTMK